LADVIDITELIKQRKKDQEEAEHAGEVNWDWNDDDFVTVAAMTTDEIAEEIASALRSPSGKGMRNLSMTCLMGEFSLRLEGLAFVMEDLIQRYYQDHN
jgi:hypothetical protein